MNRFRLILVLLTVLVSVTDTASAADSDPYTIRFSEDDKLRTSLNWINLRPDVIRPSALPVVAFPQGWLGVDDASAWRFNYAFLRTTNTNTFGGLGLTNALWSTD
jgi:hypothetical protein